MKKKKQQKESKQKETVRSYISDFAESNDRPKSGVDEERKYICKFCEKEFENGNKLSDHLSTH